MDAIKVSRKQIANIVTATFPEYSGRKFKVSARESVALYDLNWSGGTRSQYRACSISGVPASQSADNQTHPAYNRQEGANVPIPVGVVIVEHAIFCGKDMGLRVHCNPADMRRLVDLTQLPAGV